MLRTGSATSSDWRLKHRRRGQNVQSDLRREVNRWRSIAPGTPGKKFKAALMFHDKSGPTAQQLLSGQSVVILDLARSTKSSSTILLQWNLCAHHLFAMQKAGEVHLERSLFPMEEVMSKGIVWWCGWVCRWDC